MFLRSRIVRTLHLARQRLSEAVRGRLFPCRATRTQSGPLSLSAKIRRATTSGQPQSHRIIVRVASKRLLAAHERAALDELWDRFHACLRPLASQNKLGVVVFQFQASFAPSAANMTMLAGECEFP